MNFLSSVSKETIVYLYNKNHKTTKSKKNTYDIIPDTKQNKT